MDPTDNGPRWVLALTSVVSFMVSLDSQVVATALPAPRWAPARAWLCSVPPPH